MSRTAWIVVMLLAWIGLILFLLSTLPSTDTCSAQYPC